MTIEEQKKVFLSELKFTAMHMLNTGDRLYSSGFTRADAELVAKDIKDRADWIMQTAQKISMQENLSDID